MTKFTKIKKAFLKSRLTFFLLCFLLVTLSIFTIYNIYYSRKIYPGVQVAGVKVGGLGIEEASKKLERQTAVPEKILLKYQDENFEIKPSEIGVNYDFIKSSEGAFNIDRTGNILFDFASRVKALYKTRDLGLRLTLNEEELTNQLSVIEEESSQDPIEPSVKIVGKEVVVDKGIPGSLLDKKLLRAEIGRALAFVDKNEIALPIKIVDYTLSSSEVETFKARSEKIYQKSIALKFEFQSFTVSGNELLSLLNPKEGFSEENIGKKIDGISLNVNRDPQDSRFVFENGKAKEFAPSKDGIKLDSKKLKEELINALSSLESGDQNQITLDIPVEKAEAKIKTADVNNLGIKELIGRGTSRFAGSIPTRVYNISLASSRINGTLVAPGEVMSFNCAVGDVSALTGYKQAYVIKDGKTILGDGGGLCQVSTTLFRAALNSGLPIIERRAHSYRVGYYEQDGGPGLDATVYAPTTDFKIKNDTPGYILIQTVVDPKAYTLVFEIYGTSDGRVSNVTKPVVSQVVSPAEDLYQDDPTLPLGTVRQVEHRAKGAKVAFDYKVERGGSVVYEKRFVSNYRPWQAVYLRGTAPVQ